MGRSKSKSSSRDDERRRKKKKKKDEKKKKRERSSPDRKKTTKKAEDDMVGPAPPPELAKQSRSLAPMTKEEWEKKQSVVKRVYDEESGRYRLVKGDGEILEEIVSKDRHKEINRQATLGDGEYFQSVISKNVKK